MKKYYIEFTKSKIIYSEEHDIFLAPDLKGLGDIRDFESDKHLFQLLHDVRLQYSDETMISVSEERETNHDDNRLSVLLGYGHTNRDELLNANNLYWQIPSSKFITLKTESEAGVEATYYMWVLHEKFVQKRINSKCEAMKCFHVSHVIETVEEARASMNEPSEIKTPEKEKKSTPPKKEVVKPVKRIPRKKKKVAKEDRDYISANLPRKLKKFHGSKAQRKAGLGKKEYKPPKAKVKSERKKPKNPPTIQKPKRKLSNHQLHLERAHLKKIAATNIAKLEVIRKQIHRAHVGPIAWYDPAKQLPSEHYNTPRIDTTVLTVCERRYLHYLNLAQGLEMKCEKALTELNRYKSLVEKYHGSKSEKKKEKAERMEKNIIPNLKIKYRQCGEEFNEAARLRQKWHAKVEAMLDKAYEPKKKKSTKPGEVVHPIFEKNKDPKHTVMVCMKNNDTGAIVRITKEIGDTLHTKDPKQFTYTGKEEWKAWKKKERKGTYHSGVVPFSQGRVDRDKVTTSGKLLRDKLGSDFTLPKFERNGEHAMSKAVQQHKQSKNVYGAMPRTRQQKVTIKIPERSMSGRSIEVFHVYAQDAVQFTFKSNRRKIVKGEDGKLFIKDLNPVVFETRVGKRVLLEKRELNYNYSKPASTVTKTIIHNSTYTDCTSMTTNLKPVKRRKDMKTGKLNRNAKHNLRKKRNAKRKAAK